MSVRAINDGSAQTNVTMHSVCVFLPLRRNEEVDDKTLIQQLKRRIAELEAQMACLRLTQVGRHVCVVLCMYICHVVLSIWFSWSVL